MSALLSAADTLCAMWLEHKVASSSKPALMTLCIAARMCIFCFWRMFEPSLLGRWNPESATHDWGLRKQHCAVLRVRRVAALEELHAGRMESLVTDRFGADKSWGALPADPWA